MGRWCLPRPTIATLAYFHDNAPLAFRFGKHYLWRLFSVMTMLRAESQSPEVLGLQRLTTRELQGRLKNAGPGISLDLGQRKAPLLYAKPCMKRPEMKLKSRLCCCCCCRCRCRCTPPRPGMACDVIKPLALRLGMCVRATFVSVHHLQIPRQGPIADNSVV